MLKELYPVRGSWHNIGLELDIPIIQLGYFKQKSTHPLNSLHEMLQHWLETAVDPHPTWEAIVTALRSPLVNENYLAEKLESKYCAPVQLMREESSSRTKIEEGGGIVIITLFCNFGFSLQFLGPL